MKIVVSLISEQSVPNLLFIKNNHDADYFVNIITKKISNNNCYKHIKEAIEWIDKSKFKPVMINKENENNIKGIQYDIEQFNIKTNMFDNADEIYVNITGSTKMISIAAYTFFKDKYADKSTFFYLNYDDKSTSYYIVDSKREEHNKIIHMDNSLTLEEYLKSYGITIKNNSETTPKYSKELAEYIVEHSLDKSKAKLRKNLSLFVNNYLNEKYEKESMGRNKSIHIKLKQELDKINIVSYIEDIHNNFKEFPDIDNITYDSLKYLSSIYFEEYIYYKIKDMLPDYNNIHDYLKTGVKIDIDNPAIISNNSNNSSNEKWHNELDVLFIHNNTIYYIECKTFADKEIINNAIYRQRTVLSHLGLKNNNYFATLNRYDPNTLKIYKDKMILRNIHLIDGATIKHNEIHNIIKL